MCSPERRSAHFNSITSTSSTRISAKYSPTPWPCRLLETRLQRQPGYPKGGVRGAELAGRPSRGIPRLVCWTPRKQPQAPVRSRHRNIGVDRRSSAAHIEVPFHGKDSYVYLSAADKHRSTPMNPGLAENLPPQAELFRQHVANLFGQHFAAEGLRQELDARIQHAVVNHGVFGVAGKIDHLHIRPGFDEDVG